MLKARLMTGVPLAVIFIAIVLFVAPLVLSALFAVFVLLGAWEWSRLSGLTSVLSRAVYLCVIAGSLLVATSYGDLLGAVKQYEVRAILGASCFAWAIGLLWVKGYPSSAILWRSSFARLIMGYWVLVPAWIAAIFLLSVPLGPYILIAMVATVVVADVGAYFFGRALGRHKLAPNVSPSKTWEGFWGGFVASGLLAALIWWVLPVELSHLSLQVILGLILSTALASVLGDLMVSMVKRESGHKDSGVLLPGHGGVLDRLDSICGAAPVFALGYMLVHW